MILCDRDIRREQLNHNLIDPFSEPVSGDGKISYGLTSAGYDLRLGPEILVFKGSYGLTIDPKRFHDEVYRNQVFDRVFVESGSVVIPAHGYILGRSLEYLRFPSYLKGRIVGKSTMARAGILVNTTPAEPAWHGHLTLEIGNMNSSPAIVYVGEGIAQLEYETLSGIPDTDYATKGGKYQGQLGVTPAIVSQ